MTGQLTPAVVPCMSYLPTELIFSIFEHGYYTPKGSPDYDLLANCALVCKSWSFPAQSLLFYKTTPLLAPTAATFHTALLSSAEREKPLGYVVRSLNISIRADDSLSQSRQLDTLASLLEACPLLYELTLSTYGLHELDQFALAKLKPAGEGIRALYLQSCGVQSPLLFQLLGIWSDIRFLKIGAEIAAWPWRNQGRTPVYRPSRINATTGAARGADVDQRPPSRVVLYDLALVRIPQPSVLTWLLGSSTTSLRILDLREAPGREERETLGVHAPHLRSLRLLHFNLDSASLLSQCTRLKELVLYTMPVLIPLAPALPSTIQHLSFRNPEHAKRHTLRPILDAIKVLPNLRLVTCDKQSERLRDFASLKDICTERCIKVVISEVPIWVYEDPVPVRRFPRRHSVSNFGLMTGRRL